MLNRVLGLLPELSLLLIFSAPKIVCCPIVLSWVLEESPRELSIEISPGPVENDEPWNDGGAAGPAVCGLMVGISGSTTNAKVIVAAAPPLSLPVRVMVNEPASVGMPEMVRFPGLNCRPCGRPDNEYVKRSPMSISLNRFDGRLYDHGNPDPVCWPGTEPETVSGSLTAVTVRLAVPVSLENGLVWPLVVRSALVPAVPENWSHARKLKVGLSELRVSGTKRTLSLLASNKAEDEDTEPKLTQLTPLSIEYCHIPFELLAA